LVTKYNQPMLQNYLVEFEPYIFLVGGLILLIVSLFRNSSKSRLKETGIPVEGIVFEQGFEETINVSSDFSSPPVKDKITIRFVTLSGEWITEAINQDFSFFYTGQYKNGEPVKVYYEKDNPKNFFVDTKQSELTVRILGSVTGIGFSLYGLYEIFIQ